MVNAIKLHEKDNVASVFDAVAAGSRVLVLDKKGVGFEITVNQDIPYGHKIAIAPVAIGEQVTKYGEEIGIATTEITVGDHVPVHNIESIRGRGDWDKASALAKGNGGVR